MLTKRVIPWLKKKQIPKVCLFELFEKYVISDHATVWIYRENIRIPPILANEKPPTRQKGKRLQIFFLFEILKAFNDNNPNCIQYSCEIKDDCHAFTGT